MDHHFGYKRNENLFGSTIVSLFACNHPLEQLQSNAIIIEIKIIHEIMLKIWNLFLLWILKQSQKIRLSSKFMFLTIYVDVQDMNEYIFTMGIYRTSYEWQRMNLVCENPPQKHW